MNVKVRADNHFHTATLTGKIGSEIVAMTMSSKVSFPKATSPNVKIIKIEDDIAFTIKNSEGEVRIMLFKGYYLVIEE